MKPHITRDFPEDHEFMRLAGWPARYRILFPPSGDDHNHPETGEPMGAQWWAADCEYVRASIAAWYRDGLNGLTALHNERYGVM